MAAKYSGESQPLVHDGVIYVTAGNDDVFAVSVDSGKILWQYKANLDQKISTVCCGWLNRGVAIGDGRVYLGQLDGKVVALDQKTGAVVWTRQLVQWQKGQTITGARSSSTERSTSASSAPTSARAASSRRWTRRPAPASWRFYTIPAPGEPGSDTWPERRRVRAGRRLGLDDARRSTRTSACSTSRPGTPGTTGTAAIARATTFTPRRSSRSTATRAS